MTTASWIRTTWGGWLLGVPCVIVLALLGEALGIGGSQVLVGGGMGAGVGLMQARALRGTLPQPRLWFFATLIGLALPFGAVDLAHLLHRDLAYSLLWSVAIGGALVGLLQGRLLRTVLAGSWRWVLASFLGWLLAAAAVAAADAAFRSHKIAGLIGALIYLGLIAVGGLFLGLFTAPVITRLRAEVKT